MRAALGLARRGLGRVAPNPAVGCVIVKDGRLLGRGWTGPGGRPHAEAVALAQAGEAARGAAAYVSLEPCAHHGKTPPCADALAAAGVARVVAAHEDPDPRVRGRGLARLREAGIEVETGVLEGEARALNAGFLSRHERGRPFVTLKLAGSLDGRIATASGDSRWITGEESRRRVHLMRAEADAILVGMGTLRADDPGMDVRLPGLEERSPLPVLLDPELSTPPGAKLVARAGARPLLILHGPGAAPERAEALARPGVELAEAPPGPGGLDLAAVMAALAARGVTRVFCEGGGRLAAGLIRAGLADEVVWFTGGAAIGAEGLPALGGLGLDRLAEAPRYVCTGLRSVGGDAMAVWRPA
ncbi:MAG: bifunctional diaminohydroxyphosphoribosylaminopyrimidine deaminase/5-amino-6-(5-phosphoribosylamino)uracil reductase RibD [Pseudomonadota bacterium]